MLCVIQQAPEAEKKKMPSAAAPAPADEVDAQIKQSTEVSEKVKVSAI